MKSLPRAVLAALLVLTVLPSGCRSLASEKVGAPRLPEPPDLSAPEPAVRSYLDWISLAYRMANSEAASLTVSPWEGVRVDSYIQLNRQENRGIEQRLLSFEKRSESIDGTGAVLAARERWRYRYFALDTLKYQGPEHEASYETTYALLKGAKGWLVDKVEAKPIGKVE